MVVQHNMQAMNANRMLGITTRSQAKTTEKLSSGYRINRAADDAAGLSISEKMRKQIKGLDQASTNAQDGISAVQTAEGALTEVHAMLQRMNELAVQAANGTNAESDRQSIQDEIEQLTTEIDRVAETTKFNESYLLKGNGKETTISINAKDAGIAGELTGVGTGLATFKMEALDNGEQITIGSKGFTIGTDIETIKGEVGKLTAGEKITINGTEYYVVNNGETDPANKDYTKEELQSMISDADKVIIGSESYVAMIDGTGATGEEAMVALGEVTDGATIEKVCVVRGDEIIEFAIRPLADGENLTWKVTPYATKGHKVTIDGKVYDVVAADVNDEELLEGQVQEGKIGAKLIALNATSYIEQDGRTGVAVSAEAVGKTLKEGDVITVLDNNGDKVNFIDSQDDNYEEVTIGKTIFNADNIGENDASIISKEEAYRLIGEELLKASSVGCEPGSEATAVIDEGEEDAFTFLGADGQPVETVEEAVTVRYNFNEATVVAKQGLQFTLHVGADADESNKIALTIDAMDAAGLGIKNMNVLDNTGAKATYAIDSIADAISKVSAQRSALGAIQNRLEHTIANLDNVVENTTAAESQIRDTDMAEAMVEYSKNNILAQAGQSMLAQANQATQGVMSLLQ